MFCCFSSAFLHTAIFLLFLFLCLHTSLFVYLRTPLSIYSIYLCYISIHPSMYLCVYLFVYPSIYLPYLYLHPYLYLRFYLLCIYLPTIFLFIYLFPIYASIYYLATYLAICLIYLVCRSLFLSPSGSLSLCFSGLSIDLAKVRRLHEICTRPCEHIAKVLRPPRNLCMALRLCRTCHENAHNLPCESAVPAR